MSDSIVTVNAVSSDVAMYEGCTVNVSECAVVTPAAWNKAQKGATDIMHAVCYNLLGGKLHKSIQKAIDEDYDEVHAPGYNKTNGAKKVLINLLPQVDDTTCRALAVIARFTQLQVQCAWETRKGNLKQVTARSLNPRGLAEGLKTCYPQEYADVTGRAVSPSTPSTPSLDADTAKDENVEALQGRAEHAETAELSARAWMLKRMERVPAEWLNDYPAELGWIFEAMEYCKKGGKLPE